MQASPRGRRGGRRAVWRRCTQGEPAAFPFSKALTSLQQSKWWHLVSNLERVDADRAVAVAGLVHHLQGLQGLEVLSSQVEVVRKRWLTWMLAGGMGGTPPS